MNYLEKRRNLWYATLTIPKRLRHLVGGKAKYIQSTGCADKGQAQIVALQLVAGWKKKLTSLEDGSLSPDYVKALSMKNDLDNGGFEGVEEIATDWIEDKVESGAISEEKGIELADVMFGRTVHLQSILPEWEATLRVDKDKPRSRSQKISAGREVAEYFTFSSKVSTKSVATWARHLIAKQLSASSIARRFNAARSIWRFLQEKELVDGTFMPFVVPVLVAEHFRDMPPKAPRYVFSQSQAVELLNAARNKGDTQLADLIMLAMYTGARINELCSMRVENCSETILRVSRAKNQSGFRNIPVHSALVNVVRRLLKDSKDGFLISGLSAPPSSNERSKYIGERFSKLREEIGLPTGYVFHSFRMVVCTLFENAGVLEGVAADIVGHKKRTMTYGLYSGGNEIEIKKAAIEKLSYPM